MARQDIKKSRFNVFDVLIIFIVIACIAGIVIRYRYLSEETMKEQVTVDFIVPDVMASTAEKMTSAIKGGTIIYLSSGDTIIGFIQSVSSENAQVYATNASGALERVNHPTNMDVRGVAVLYGKSGESGFLIGSNTLATLSEVLYVYTDSVEFGMTIISISEPTAK